MSTLRDGIEDQFVQYAIRMESPIIEATATDRFVDAIIALFREAMLSDGAVEATWAVFGSAIAEKRQFDMRDAITAALKSIGAGEPS